MKYASPFVFVWMLAIGAPRTHAQDGLKDDYYWNDYYHDDVYDDYGWDYDWWDGWEYETPYGDWEYEGPWGEGEWQFDDDTWS